MFTVNRWVVDVTIYSKPLCCVVFTVNHYFAVMCLQ